MAEFSKAINELCPQVPLYMKNNSRAYNSDIQGFNLNAGGTTYYEQFSWGNKEGRAWGPAGKGRFRQDHRGGLSLES